MSDGVVVKHLLSTSFPMLGLYFLLQEKTLMLWNKIADRVIQQAVTQELL